MTEYVEALLSHGVTATADGFYGPGIVAGVPAVRFFKEAFERMPIRLIFLVPTLSWLQNRELGSTPTPGITSDDPRELSAGRAATGSRSRRICPSLNIIQSFSIYSTRPFGNARSLQGTQPASIGASSRHTRPSVSLPTTSQ